MAALRNPPGGAREPDDDRVVITGAACRLPGGVVDLAGAAAFFAARTDAVADVPADRWDRDVCDPTGAEPGTTRSHRGAFLADPAGFDARFFSLGRSEAEAMDPQHRLLLEVGWEAMRAVEPRRDAWSGTRTGTYVGLLATDYRTLHVERGRRRVGVHYASGTEASFAAGRLAFHFDLTGPAIGFTTACSSSLVALTTAADALRLGHVDAAVVGGVSLLLAPELSVYMSTIGALSPTGTCRPFTTAADGMVRGEGCVAVVLHRESDARRLGLRPWAAIRGYGTNHDGWSAGLTSPNPAAQTALLSEVWRSSGTDPADLRFLEMHGTGTALGDPTEAAAVAAALAGRRDGRPLPIGSHKANLGHLDAAAGLLGLLKAVTVVHSGVVPGQPDGAAPAALPNGLALAVDTTRDPDDARPRLAAVNAFGLSGTNAHVVVEELDDTAWPSASDGDPGVVLCSGRDADDLAAIRETWSAPRPDGSLPLADPEAAAASLRTAHGPHRLALVGTPEQRAVTSDEVTGVAPVTTAVHLECPSPRRRPWTLAELRAVADDPATAARWRRACAAADAAGLDLGDRVRAGDPALATDARLGLAAARAAVLAVVGRLAADGVELGAGDVHPDLAPAVAAALGEGEVAAAFDDLDPTPADGPDGQRAGTVIVLEGTPEALATLVDGASAARWDPSRTRAAVPLNGTTTAALTDLVAEAAPLGVAVRLDVATGGGDHPARLALPTALRDGAAGYGRLLADLWVAGARVAGAPGSCHALPAVRWRHERYWSPVLESPPATTPTPPPTPEPSPEPEPVAARPPQTDRLREVVAREVARALETEVADLPGPAAGLMDAGLGSLAAVELSRRLADELAVPLPTTFVLENPSVDALVTALAALGTTPPPAAEPVVADAAQPDVPPEAPAGGRDDAHDLAVVGYGFRLPQVDGDDELWRVLDAGTHTVTERPANRPGAELWTGLGPGTPTRAAWLDDVAGFDHDYFTIAPVEARWIDPQHRLLLEVTVEALVASGLGAPGRHAPESTGVVCALDSSDYAQLATRDPGGVSAYYGTGGSPSAAAGRVSYALGLRGPSLTVDTACSSSLAAVSIARGLLLDGSCDQVVVAAANLALSPAIASCMTRAGALARDGRCKTFSAAADGYGRGEGAVTVVLKRLSRARADGDHVHAVLESVALNQDGASGGFTVPSMQAQQEVVAAALRQAGRRADEPVAVETHGTGTALGDPLELRALDGCLAGRDVAVGTAKTSFGHLEAAAGLLGLLKVLLALRHRRFPAHPLDGAEPTGEFAWAESRLRLSAGEPLAADAVVGLSSFGFTGTNAHAVVRGDHDDPTPAEPARPGTWVLPVSAHTEAACARRLHRLARAATDWDVDDLGTVVHHLVHAPTHRFRTALHAESGAALLDALRAAADTPPDVHRLDAREGGPAFDLGEQADAGDVAARFVAGATPCWETTAPRTAARLPAYPWEHVALWLPTSAVAAPAPAPPPAPAPTAARTATVSPRDVLEVVLHAVADSLEVDAATLAPTTGFFDLGLDSIQAVAITTRLGETYGVEVDSTATFEYPTPAELAEHVVSLLDDAPAATPASPAPARPTPGPPPTEATTEATGASDALDAALSQATALLSRGALT